MSDQHRAATMPLRCFDVVDAIRLLPDPYAIHRLDATAARRHGVVPLAYAGDADGATAGRLLLAAHRSDDALLREAVRCSVAEDIALEWREASVRFVALALDACYPAPLALDAQIARFVQRGLRVNPIEDDDEASVIELVDAMLHEACGSGASDVHLTPTDRHARLRLRVDGRLLERGRWPEGGHAALVQRLKVLASLDIADCRTPQDGRFTRLQGERDVAFRVSTFPVEGGENVVLRVQDPGRRPGSLAALGLSSLEVSQLHCLLSPPSGLLLLAGPTGSGKTTTLYALLGELDDGTRNLVTLEDPVEYPLVGVVQTAVDPARGLDYAAGVRALLRQDPDVLMIGEIRDAATVSMALRAALAGHRVLATVHAADALACVARLIDLGADVPALAACLNGIVAQRLLPNAQAGGRFAVIETLIATPLLREALLAGGAAGVARHDAEQCRERLPDVANRALRDGRTRAIDLERVFGATGVTA